MWIVVPIIFIILIGVYFFFFARRAIRLSKLSPRTGSIVALAISIVLTVPSFAYFIGWSVWALVVLYLGSFCLIFDLIAFLWRLIVRKKIKVLRYLYVLGVFPVLITSSLIIYGAANIYDVRETVYTVKSDKVQQNYKIALFTDTHYGLLDNRDALIEIASSVSGNVDLVLLGGDITDERSTLAEVNEIFEIFGAIKSTYGTYYVYGNHDTAQYSQSADFTKQQLDDAVARNGIRTLADESVTLGDLLLTGRKDRSSTRKTPKELLYGTDDKLFRICLDHSPYGLDTNAGSGFDLTLSGHTHAGQIFPIGVFNELFGLSGDLNYGKETVGGMTAIVTSGVTGWGFPVRTQGHSEYVIIGIEPNV